MKRSRLYLLLAKVGHKLPGNKAEQAEALWEHTFDEEIETYGMKRLSTILDILSDKNLVDDLVMLVEERKFSLDYDYKREVLEGGFTKPHQSMDDFRRFRAVSNTLREKKGLRATPELVNFYQIRAKQNVRLRGSAKADCIRHFSRALVQGVKPFGVHKSYIDVSKKLKSFGVTVNSLKNAKRTPFAANIIFNSSSNRSCIRKMLTALGYKSDDNYQAWLDLLIHKGLSNPVTMFG